MKVTAEGIRESTFSKSFRGYDTVSVDQFLNSLSHEWQKEIDEKTSLLLQLEKSEKELNRLKEVETVMFKAMKEADDNATVLIENATANAANIIGKAQADADAYYDKKKNDGDEYLLNAENTADKVILDAEMERDRLLLEANETVENLKISAKSDIESSENEYKSLDIAKQQLLYDLKSLLGNTNDRLENVQTKYSPELFDAKKQTLNNIEKAKVEAKPIKAIAKPIKATIKTNAVKVVKPKAIKKAVVKVTKKVKQQVDIESEDDGLPTVQKILAITEDMNLPQAELQKVEILGNKVEGNKSFFDSI